MLGEEATGLEHVEADRARTNALAQSIIDLLIVEEANIEDSLSALAVVMCFNVQQFDSPLEVFEDVYDEIVANITGGFGDKVRAQAEGETGETAAP